MGVTYEYTSRTGGNSGKSPGFNMKLMDASSVQKHPY